ncbi:MAG: class I SAM-dependent methyltransferase [Thermoproteota archaeon]
MLKIYKSWDYSRERGFLELLEKVNTCESEKVKVIDLGCGNGNFTLKVKEKIGCKSISGLDIHKPALEEAKKKSIKVIEWDLNNFPYPFKDEEFDIVVSNQVIEHLFFPIRFLKEVYRILKPHGYAVISTENLASWDNIFSLILGYTPTSMHFDCLRHIGNPLSLHEKEIEKSTFPPHVRIFSYRGLIEAVKFIGFKISKVVGNGHILGRLGERIDKTHCRFITIKIKKANIVL